MTDAIVIINTEDIPHAVNLARELKDYRVYVFDPVLFDKVAAYNLTNIELIVWEGCPLYKDLTKVAINSAFAFEEQLNASVREITPEVSISSWQHLNLYYFFMSIKWYGSLWNELGHKLAGNKLHILICNKPSSYYFNSFVPSLLLLQYLSTQGIDFLAYNYGDELSPANLVPDLVGACRQSQVETMLAHLPTCFYDIGYFNQEIQAAGKELINIKAKKFDMPVLASQHLDLIDAEGASKHLPDELQERVSAFSGHLSGKLDSLLMPDLATNDYRQRQAGNLAALYTSQLVTYYLLNQYFSGALPSKLLLSDHDIGFHGPIVSFAQKHNIPILMLPHSKTTFDIEFKYPNITAFTHPIQGDEIFDAKGRNVPSYKLSYPEKFSSSTHFQPPLKTISLLFSAFTLNGIYYNRYETYMGGIKKIVDWCKENEIDLRIRCKPSYSLFSLLAQKTGASLDMLVECAGETMEQHVETCDLCILYDEPSSASLHFLRGSKPIVNIVTKHFSPAEMTWMNKNLIPRDGIEETLHRIGNFKSDPVSFFLFRKNQFNNYITLFKESKPLRTFL